MKNFFALTFLVLSFNVFANSDEGTAIVVPYPQSQSAYYGGIDRVEKEVKEELIAKAVAVCKSKKNIAAIADVEVKVAFSLIEINDEDKFEGGYPLASASALVFCHKKL